ncbi:MAG: substrate-binding domain-containing protein [Myxococcota bacterium]
MNDGIRRIVLILLASLLQVAIASAALAGEFRVIVNEASPVKSLRTEEVQRYMLGKTTRWPHGLPVQAVDQSQNASTRAAFSRDVLGKSVSAVKGYWQSQIFSGRGVPPAELPTDEAVIDFVRRNPGAIGYVASGTPLVGVKAIELE